MFVTGSFCSAKNLVKLSVNSVGMHSAQTLSGTLTTKVLLDEQYGVVLDAQGIGLSS